MSSKIAESIWSRLIPATIPSVSPEVPCPTGVWLSSTPYPACFIGFFSEPVNFPYLPIPVEVEPEVAVEPVTLTFSEILRLDDEYCELRDMVRNVKFHKPSYIEAYSSMVELLPRVTERQWCIVRGINDYINACQTRWEKTVGDTQEKNDRGYRASGDCPFGRMVIRESWDSLTDMQLTRLLGWVWTYRAQLETKRTKRGVVKKTGAIMLGLVIPR